MLITPTSLRALLVASLFLPRLTSAQDIRLTNQHPTVVKAMASMRQLQAWTLQQQVSICEIPAPPFKESARADEFKRRMIALGYADTRIDAVGNVISQLGAGSGPTVMFAAHLDTVFPEGTDVKTTRTGDRIAGPGIGDDCRGLAVLLTLAKVMKETGLTPAGRVYLVANVGEEGPGNLRGTRHLFGTEFPAQINYFVSVDGGGGAEIVSRAVGSHRYTISFAGPGGHSYEAFGMTNPAHAMGRAIAHIADLQPPAGAKTTFNVGVVRGGTSVNTITPLAQMEVDIRSESADNLLEMDRRLRAAVARGVAEELARWPASKAPITVRYDTIGIRPTGSQRDDAYLVRVAKAAAGLLDDGLTWMPRTIASSTDANIPISLGIPAIAINGGGGGGGAHGASEWYQETTDSWKGPQYALLILTALTGVAR